MNRLSVHKRLFSVKTHREANRTRPFKLLSSHSFRSISLYKMQILYNIGKRRKSQKVLIQHDFPDFPCSLQKNTAAALSHRHGVSISLFFFFFVYQLHQIVHTAQLHDFHSEIIFQSLRIPVRHSGFLETKPRRLLQSLL